MPFKAVKHHSLVFCRETGLMNSLTVATWDVLKKELMVKKKSGKNNYKIYWLKVGKW